MIGISDSRSGLRTNLKMAKPLLELGSGLAQLPAWKMYLLEKELELRAPTPPPEELKPPRSPRTVAKELLFPDLGVVAQVWSPF